MRGNKMAMIKRSTIKRDRFKQISATEAGLDFNTIRGDLLGTNDITEVTSLQQPIDVPKPEQTNSPDSSQ
jgi:hypothetical protein